MAGSLSLGEEQSRGGGEGERDEGGMRGGYHMNL